MKVSSRITPILADVVSIKREFFAISFLESKVTEERHKIIIAKNERWISKSLIESGKITERILVSTTPDKEPNKNNLTESIFLMSIALTTYSWKYIT
jgi:hypothetical protein